MPLDPQARALLDQMEEAGMPALNEMSPAEAREMAAAFIELAGPGQDVASVEDRSIPGPHGDIPVRIYRPSEEGTLPVLVYFHGGGWVIGDVDTLDTTCRALANESGAAVVSVDYRLAPEHPYPVPFDECLAATAWVSENADELGVDAGALAVGGDSAGGNLAAAVALAARDQGGPGIAFQALVYPVTDHAYDTDSYQANGEGYLLTADMMRWFWDHYLSGGAADDHQSVSPLRAEDLSGVAPAFVVTAEFDPLRDEGEAYAARLADAGVDVTAKRYDGQIHAFFQMPATFDRAAEAISDVSEAMRKAFADSA
jgi:acetyl esterase